MAVKRLIAHITMLRLNLRRYESFCCYLTAVFPKALTSGLLLYGLHGLLFECIPLLESTGSKLFVGTVGIWLFAQCIYTYFKVISAGCGSPTDFPELRSQDSEVLTTISSADDLEAQVNAHESYTEPPQFLIDHSVQVKSNGKMRYCNKCACWKPDRTHHCSSCNQCQLKMDHHCPWFASCVGFRNHKFFIQFLVLSVLYTGLLFAVSGEKIYRFFSSESYLDDFISINLLIVCILAMTLSISVAVFTGMSLYFVLTNTTTIESSDNVRYRNNMKIIEDIHYVHSRKPSAREYGNVYNLGIKRNWRAVMGESYLEWFLPIDNRPSGDYYRDNGLVFDTDPVVYAQLQKNTHLQNQLLEQLNALRN